MGGGGGGVGLCGPKIMIIIMMIIAVKSSYDNSCY